MRRIWVCCDGCTGAQNLAGTGAVARARGTDEASTAAHGAEAFGAGAVALEDSGRILAWDWRALPPMTNNEAEYAGLLLGIGLAQRLGGDETIFLLDSEIVVGQMTGRCAVNSRSLHRWHWQACEALRGLTTARFCAIPREWNRLADGLAAQAGIRWEWLCGQVDRTLSRADLKTVV
jgi:ribonuclease HI